MLRPSFARRLPRRGLAVLVGFLMAGNAQAADLWTIAQDALANDAELSSTQAAFQATEAARDLQRGTLLPQISVGGNAAHTRTYSSSNEGLRIPGVPAEAFETEDSVNSVGLSLDAEQALYDPTRRAQLERAEREIDRDALGVDAAAQQLLFDVSNAYFEILRAHDVLSARRAQETAIERQLEQAQERFEVGLIAITDVHEAQASYDLARAQRLAAEGAMRVSFEALERLTGHRYDSIEALDDEVPIARPVPADREAWVELAMANSPLVLSAEAAIEVARSSVDISRAARQPTLSAFASYGWSESDRTGTDEQSESQVGLRASLPLYTGGSTQARIRQSGFLLEASQYDFEAQRRDTIQQVRSLFTRVNNDVETVEARRQAIVSNQSALEATRSGYEVGTRNIVDVLNAEQNLFNAIAEHAEARYDYILGLLQLQQQAGLLGPDSIQSVNAWLSEGERVSLELPDEANDDPVMNIGERPQAPS
ncbi:TolC family outer membrane protein [Halomonas sp. MCCC 1A17488]|uniref:TolC family outer membrane protein n=1 Tax=unclassified Halomonas TaxID=2609666 RepID=UPI0018D24833|nr:MULTISPECIES: TolC family outer membrane protein [unclassified Halomonas]MCE8018097.1 TolC family outer membrane protein [Halomonas sp. MCCC 1A17488]MCG3241430.1 TolC family outer membrane protein [Halomonas sp. MCCC 1A17488]QPP48609.1 TolC family outer membrane protein [Halomonas sp. SS10-MC5]